MPARRPLVALACALLLGACATSPPAEFEHGFSNGPTPWTGREFDRADDAFTFALFSDLTGGEREDVFEVAIAQLNLLRPEFIIGVGDLIEGGTTDRARLASEWDSFDRRAGGAEARLFYTGGNHDLTNPVMWEVFDQRYGARYYHFAYRDALFLVLDTEDSSAAGQWALHEIRDEALAAVKQDGWGVFMETAYGQSAERRFGRVGEGQADYFLDVLAEYPDVRHTFVVLHKPVWEREGEAQFARLEQALSGRPYTVFYGHEHSYLHQRRNGRDYIRLGTTGGVQNPAKDLAIDHVTLVTVSGKAVDIANLRMSGIFGKDGRIPLNGEELCFDVRACGPP
ncbi:MAG: metallophosphoesterase [Gammaproteobacteria bacterium]|nr:metallophosphoesterase [Gammaproteobacteria bacterium]MBT8050160.1 metallophosphoesterase [Gammaproteobacteria bacterium]